MFEMYLSREEIWTDMRTIDEILRLDPILEIFHRSFTGMQNELNTQIDEVKLLNEVLYQSTRIVNDRLSYPVGNYVYSIQVEIRDTDLPQWPDSSVLTLTIVYFLLKLRSGNTPRVVSFLNEIERRVSGNCFWHTFEFQYNQLRERECSLVYKFPHRPDMEEVNEIAAQQANRGRGCFRNQSDFVREQVSTVVKRFHVGIHARLALIEVTLYCHGLLNNRNSHKAFVNVLIEWGIIQVANDEEKKRIINALADKYRRLPTEGYKDWNGNSPEKETCIKIGQTLGPTMPYRT